MEGEPRRFVTTLRTWLDVLSTVGILTVCIVLLWGVSKREPSSAAATGTASVPSRASSLPSTPVSIADAWTKGNKAARVAIIEYSDFQCPFCGSHARQTLPALHEKYADSGKVLFAFRHLPLTQIHPLAMQASEAAECAGRQGKFWDMHHELFKDQKELAFDSLLVKARTIGLQSAAFRACLGGEVRSKVDADMANARSLGITGTPAFLLGPVQGDGRIKITQRLSGAVPLQEFETAIEKLLNSAQQ